MENKNNAAQNAPHIKEEKYNQVKEKSFALAVRIIHNY